MHRDGPMQVAIHIVRENDLAEDPGIPIEAVPPAPQRQARLFLATTPPESAEEVLRKLPVQRLPDYDPVDQRELQILRTWRSR